MAIRTTAILATFGDASVLPHRHNSSGAGGLFGCAGTINQTLSIIEPPTHRRLQCRPTPESGSLHPCCHIVCIALSVAVCRLTRRALQPRRRQDSARHKTH